MAYTNDILEESLKLKVAADWFARFDCTDIIHRIDFAVKPPQNGEMGLFDTQYLLWAESKQQPTDVFRMLAQLLLTIRQDADNLLPPKYIGCFDNEKMAFIEYHYAMPVFNTNDFNWTQAPSAVDDKTVETVARLIDRDKLIVFDFATDGKELRSFIRQNFRLDGSTRLAVTQINKNNYTFIYRKWRERVMPCINADWDLLKRQYSIYDRDFFLAEMNIDDNGTPSIKDDRRATADFYISFDAAQKHPYHLSRKDAMGLDVAYEFGFRQGGLEHYAEFWKRYKRPPQKEYWDFIVNRLDLLVPQDVRERKGSFFTPQRWVELSQRYIADELGDDWQYDYIVWDCCAGTGNLLAGLTNKYNIWASTLDQADVDVMHDRVGNGANLLDSHVFQFDFLNDSFDKLPDGLREIIGDEEKRRKLVVYINPPYAEAASKHTVTGNGANKTDVAVRNLTYKKYIDKIGIAGRELFAQFIIRIYCEIPGAVLAQFSKLKIEQAPNFENFRNEFLATPGRSFIVPADTFDNVKGQFPIGFFIWHLDGKEKFAQTVTDVYDGKGNAIGHKTLNADSGCKTINDWIITTRNREGEKKIGYMSAKGNDFQNANYNFIINDKSQLPHPRGTWVTDLNICEISIYLAVRQCIVATWLNDRDQFLYPNDGWKTDSEFQGDCLAYTLFHRQNRISAQSGAENNWIPFAEQEVDAKDSFKSHFMSDYIRGKHAPKVETRRATSEPLDLFQNDATDAETVCIPSLQPAPVQFSMDALAVMDAGRKLWRYYHAQPGANADASFYDIRRHFHGTKTTTSGKQQMCTDSADTTYIALIHALRTAMKTLAARIEPKVYKYGFLKE